MDLSREKYVNGSEKKRMLTTETYHREKRTIYYYREKCKIGEGKKWIFATFGQAKFR
jgi:hypothetical protein